MCDEFLHKPESWERVARTSVQWVMGAAALVDQETVEAFAYAAGDIMLASGVAADPFDCMPH